MQSYLTIQTHIRTGLFSTEIQDAEGAFNMLFTLLCIVICGLCPPNYFYLVGLIHAGLLLLFSLPLLRASFIMYCWAPVRGQLAVESWFSFYKVSLISQPIVVFNHKLKLRLIFNWPFERRNKELTTRGVKTMCFDWLISQFRVANVHREK